MKTIFTTLLLIATLCAHAQITGPEQDADSAIHVCQNVYVQNNTYSGDGIVQDILSCNNTCLSNRENNSVWYRFYVSHGGMVVFSITPLVGDDYDFAVYNITGLSSFANGALCPYEVRCSYSAFTGITGLQYGAVNVTAGVADPAFLAPLAVNEGEEYLILVDNFDTGGGGYTLDFTGSTAMIGSPNALIKQANPVLCNNDTVVIVELKTDVTVSSIAADGSDFNIVGNPPVTIFSAEPVSVGVPYTNRIKLKVSAEIGSDSSYTLVLKQGSDSNTLQATSALCGAFFAPDTLLISDSIITFNIQPIADYSYVKTGQDFQYINQSTGANAYHWDFGDGAFSRMMNPYHRFQSTGIMNVCLSASNTCFADSVCMPFQYRDNIVSGKISNDVDLNCAFSWSDIPSYRRIVIAEPGPFYGISDTAGYYSINIDTGNYTIRQIVPQNSYYRTVPLCPASNEFNINTGSSYGQTFTNKDFYNDEETCHFLTIDIVNEGARFCGTTNTYIEVCNRGSQISGYAWLLIDMPDVITVTGASHSYTTDSAGNLIVYFNPLAPDDCDNLVINGQITCLNPQALLNTTHCVIASVTPLTNCGVESANWDQSHLSITGSCNSNGIITFTVQNMSQSNMGDSTEYRVYEDSVLIETGKIKLAAQQSQTFTYTYSGHLLRIEVNQTAFHPYEQFAFSTVETCNEFSGSFTPAIFNMFVQEPGLAQSASDCFMLLNSYDPNDKQVKPEGIGEAHITPVNTLLEYKVRFQNTGNDTAYDIVIIDTLSEFLDLSTLQFGVSSHPYEINLSGAGKPILSFVFNDIYLPDSTTDFAGSNGFVTYSVMPLPETPLTTVISNTADIYFDVNPPVRTNTVFNTIGEYAGTVGIDYNSISRNNFSIFPNPANSEVWLSFSSNSLGGEIKLFDIEGRMMLSKTINTTTEKLNTSSFANGIYLVQVKNEKGVMTKRLTIAR